MKLFKSTVENLYKVILMIVISSGIISFFNVIIAKFIVYVIDEIVMKNIELPSYLTMLFYSDDTFSKIIIAAILMIAMALIISIFNYIRSKYDNKDSLYTIDKAIEDIKYAFDELEEAEYKYDYSKLPKKN